VNFSSRDCRLLRDLARRAAQIAADPVMDQRRQAWVEHNSLRSAYPMMLIFPEGAWQELLPETVLRCEGAEARQVERSLRMRIHTFEHFQDDTVVEAEWIVPRRIRNSGWGLEPRRIPSPEARGAWHFDPVIREPADLKKLRFPRIDLDEAGSLQDLEQLSELFGDILAVRMAGVKHLSYHLMNQYTALRGLEEVMIDMVAEPQMLHDAMGFFAEGHHRILKQYLELNLLSFNNDNTYQNSGGNSYTDELPRPGADPARARPCDLWASAEAQELTLVSPEHHEEFSLAYEKRLLAPFGLTGYGCCDDLSHKLDLVFAIPHIRRISIAPSADVDHCAPRLKGEYLFSWKPNPAHLVGRFDEQALRRYLCHTVEITQQHDCVLEMILKDTHTCEHQPGRFDEWTRIGRQVIEEIAGPRPCPKAWTEGVGERGTDGTAPKGMDGRGKGKEARWNR